MNDWFLVFVFLLFLAIVCSIDWNKNNQHRSGNSMLAKLGDNCLKCLCRKCRNIHRCGKMAGDTEVYCEEDCLGEGKYTVRCKDYEPNR